MTPLSLLLLPAVLLSSPAVVKKEEDFLIRYAKTFRFRMGIPSSFTFTPDGRELLFLRSPGRSFVRDLYAVDLKSGRERLLLTAGKLLAGIKEKLSAEEKARRERLRLAARGLVSYQLSPDGKYILLPLSGKLYLFERASGKVRTLGSESGYPIDPRFSPDGRWIALVRDGDLFRIDLATGKEQRLTKRTDPAISYGTAEFVAQEEMGRMQGYWWSPDSRHLLFQETDERNVELIYLPNAANPAQKPASQRYPRPGKKNAVVRLFLLSLDEMKKREISWDHKAFPYLATVRWPKKGALTLLLQDRKQQRARLLAIQEKTLTSRTLLEEEDVAWLNLDQSVPAWLPDGSGFLWSSEREGGGVLELRDAQGKLVHRLTPKGLRYRRLLSLDPLQRVAYIAASPEPTEAHVYRIALDGAQWKIQRITRRSGIHNASFGKGSQASHFVLSSEESDAPRRIRVFRILPQQPTLPKASTQPTLPKASTQPTLPKASTQPTTQQPRQSTVPRRLLAHLQDHAEDPKLIPQLSFYRVGKKRLRAVVIKPRSFDAKKRYPTILSVYGGPGYRVVGRARSRYLLSQWLADKGFLVISIDGRGTPGRGRAWERAIRGDFISHPLADQIEGLQALTKLIPQMDPQRIGVFGWSFGGYFSAMAALKRPDVFRAAIAGAPVTDWLDYDTHYTERFLGLPQDDPEAYKRSDAVRLAANLQRPLLLIHGTADDNVFFLHSLKLSHALFLAQKEHDFLPLSNMTHMVRKPDALQALYDRMIRFFLQHLGSPQPLAK